VYIEREKKRHHQLLHSAEIVSRCQEQTMALINTSLTHSFKS